MWRKGALITPCASFIKYLIPDVNVCVGAPSAKRQKRDSKRDKLRWMEKRRVRVREVMFAWEGDSQLVGETGASCHKGQLLNMCCLLQPLSLNTHIYSI